MSIQNPGAEKMQTGNQEHFPVQVFGKKFKLNFFLKASLSNIDILLSTISSLSDQYFPVSAYI